MDDDSGSLDSTPVPFVADDDGKVVSLGTGEEPGFIVPVAVPDPFTCFDTSMDPVLVFVFAFAFVALAFAVRVDAPVSVSCCFEGCNGCTCDGCFESVCTVSRFASFLVVPVLAIAASKLDLAVSVLSGSTVRVGFLRGNGPLDVKKVLRAMVPWVSGRVKVFSVVRVDGNGARGIPWRNILEVIEEVMDLAAPGCPGCCESLDREVSVLVLLRVVDSPRDRVDEEVSRMEDEDPVFWNGLVVAPVAPTACADC